MMTFLKVLFYKKERFLYLLLIEFIIFIEYLMPSYIPTIFPFTRWPITNLVDSFYQILNSLYLQFY